MKSFFTGLAALGIPAALVVFLFFIPFIWPPELTLLFNSLFWSSVLLLAMCCVLVGYLYLKGGTSQNVHFFFALLLIICASLTYTSFETVAADVEFWRPALSQKHRILLTVLPQFVSYTKNIISFGFAALGASIASNVITARFAERRSKSG